MKTKKNSSNSQKEGATTNYSALQPYLAEMLQKRVLSGQGSKDELDWPLFIGTYNPLQVRPFLSSRGDPQVLVALIREDPSLIFNPVVIMTIRFLTQSEYWDPPPPTSDIVLPLSRSRLTELREELIRDIFQVWIDQKMPTYTLMKRKPGQRKVDGSERELRGKLLKEYDALRVSLKQNIGSLKVRNPTSSKWKKRIKDGILESYRQVCRAPTSIHRLRKERNSSLTFLRWEGFQPLIDLITQWVEELSEELGDSKFYGSLAYRLLGYHYLLDPLQVQWMLQEHRKWKKKQHALKNPSK